jgi:hypothetical protein
MEIEFGEMSGGRGRGWGGEEKEMKSIERFVQGVYLGSG